MKRLLIATICFSIGFSLAQAQKQFTLEQVMSAPFPSDLVAAPVGGGVAWVQIAKGVRNIWIASPPDYKGKQLTSYNEDDGEDLGEFLASCGNPSPCPKRTRNPLLFRLA